MLKALAVAPEQIWTGVPIVLYRKYSVGRSFFWSYFPPSFPLLCHSLTSSEIKHTKSLSEKSSTPDHVCQWTIDKCTPKLFFFYTLFTSVIFLLFSPLLPFPPHPSPSLPSPLKKRKEKQLTKTNGTSGANRPLSQTPPTAIAQTVASKTN